MYALPYLLPVAADPSWFGPSERNVPVLALGPRFALGLQGAQRGDQPRTGLVGDDHVVDVAALGGGVGIREARLVVVHQRFAPLLGRGAAGDIAAVDDVDGALGPHHRDLGRRPGEIEVGAEVLGGHHVVGAAVGLARDDRNL